VTAPDIDNDPLQKARMTIAKLIPKASKKSCSTVNFSR